MSRPFVLIVDDSKSTRQSLKIILVKLGAETIEAENGQEALEKYETHGKDIKLIFCDIEMPIMTGLEFIEILDKKAKETGERVPVVMLTALGQRETIIKARTFGIKGYILKPASQSDICKIYAHYVDPSVGEN